MKAQQHIHILGICGTFMAGVALLAKEMGFRVTGADANVYPPMSTLLKSQGIEIVEGYGEEQIEKFHPECFVIGNALSRGKFPVMEAILNQKLKFISGPQWVAENILNVYPTVIAVSGTHGKTTTTSMVSWILEYAGLRPGFLVGGVPENFGLSARLGSHNIFVIEADEYDTAFFDKRSKFLHYHPSILIMNNLEYDHADIFPDLNAIKTQFQYLVRTVPSNGLIIKNHQDKNIDEVLQRGCWTSVQSFGDDGDEKANEAEWKIGQSNKSQSEFDVIFKDKIIGKIHWSLMGKHNQLNALAAIAASVRAGVEPSKAIEALHHFKNVKRRMELIGEYQYHKIYSDFAHHPTAIRMTLEGLRGSVGKEKILVILECGSNTMRLGVHQAALAPSLALADKVIFLRPEKDWGIDEVQKQCRNEAKVHNEVDVIIEDVQQFIQQHQHSHIVMMSNTGFKGLFEKMTDAAKPA